MVEGCGQLNGGLNWGDGFRCDTAGTGVSSAAPFFDALLDPAARRRTGATSSSDPTARINALFCVLMSLHTIKHSHVYERLTT